MATTRLFKNGRSLAVRIPRELLPEDAAAGQTVEIGKDGDRIVIEPRSREAAFKAMLDRWAAEPPLTDDELPPPIEKLPAEPFPRQRRRTGHHR